MKLKRSLLILSLLITSAAALSSWQGAQAQAPISQNSPAPELVGKEWLNTPGGKPITLASRRGKVSIVEFWTFGCSNCRANLPAYAQWHRDYKNKGVEVLAVHTPEFDHERNPKNVARQVKELGIAYPVLLDPDSKNWQRWNQHFWPTIYLIDKSGKIRARWEGELEYGGAKGTRQMSKLIDQLLGESA